MEGAFGSFSYGLPSDKKQMIIDFYLLANMRPDADNEDINLSIKESKDALYTALQKELMDAVFFSVACEFRHVWDNTYNTKQEIAEWFEKKGYGDFLRKYLGSFGAWKTYGLKPDTTGVNVPHFEREKGSDSSRARHMSYRSAKVAAGGNDARFMQIAKDAMNELKWQSYFGGKNWGNICNGWLRLNTARTHQELELWIDHVYDLQHNTGTVFNKIKEYMRGEEKYDWIKKVLDWKANIVDPAALMDEASPEIKRLYNAYNASYQTAKYTGSGGSAPAYDEGPGSGTTVYKGFEKRGAMSGEEYDEFKNTLKKGKGKYWKLSIYDLMKKNDYKEIKWEKPEEIKVGQVVKVGAGPDQISVVRHVGKLPSGMGQSSNIWIDKKLYDKKGNKISVEYPSLAAMSLVHKEDITGVATYIEDIDSPKKKPEEKSTSDTGQFSEGDEIEVVSGNYGLTKPGSLGVIQKIYSDNGKADIMFSKLTGASSSTKVPASYNISLSHVQKKSDSKTPELDKIVLKKKTEQYNVGDVVFNINKKAYIKNPKSNYANYKKMAKILKATNYQTGKAEDKGIKYGDEVTVLASSPAEKNPAYKVYLVQDTKGNQHLFGASGIKWKMFGYDENYDKSISLGVPKLSYILERASAIMETPWVQVSDNKVIDLEFEKLRSLQGIMGKIKEELEKLTDDEQKDFIDKLFSDYWTMMNHYGIHKDEVQALVAKPHPAEEYYNYEQD